MTGILSLSAVITVAKFVIGVKKDHATLIHDQEAILIAAMGSTPDPLSLEPYVAKVGITNTGNTVAIGVGEKIMMSIRRPGEAEPVFDAEHLSSQHRGHSTQSLRVDKSGVYTS